MNVRTMEQKEMDKQLAKEYKSRIGVNGGYWDSTPTNFIPQIGTALGKILRTCSLAIQT